MWKQRSSIARELNLFAVPLIINNLMSSLIGILFSSFTGHISTNAIFITGTIDTFIYALIGILGVGTLSFNIYSSRVRDSDTILFNDFFRSIIELNGLIGLIALIFIFIFGEFLLTTLFHFNEKILVIGKLYLFIVSFKLIFSMLIFAFSNQLKIYKKTKEILVIGVLTSLFQLGLSYFLIFHFFKSDYRILGIALSTTLATFFTLCAHLLVIRAELKLLLTTKSTQKKFLFLKSIPLFIQEIIEGSVISVLITSLLAQYGALFYSSYMLCRYLTDICLTPMFMYCNGLVVLIGEKIQHVKKKELLLLPQITRQIVLFIYCMLISIMFLFKNQFFLIFTKDSNLIDRAVAIFLLVIFIEGTKPIYEVNKYSLQSFGYEKLALTITCFNNLLFITILLIFSFLHYLTFNNILILSAVNNLLAGLMFAFFYRKKVLH